MVEDEECKKCIEIVKDRQNELVCKIKTNYNDKLLKLTQELHQSKKKYESYKITQALLLDLFEIQSKRIAELEEQLKNARKETAKKVIDRVEELSVFDFKAYEEHDLRKYTITELALDNILREYGE